MDIKVTGISSYADKLACMMSGNGSTAYVHSVYERTINISDGSLLISIQKSSSPVSPLTILIDDRADIFSDPSVKAGRSVDITMRGTGSRDVTDSIETCGYTLLASDLAPVFDTEVPRSRVPSEEYLAFRDKVVDFRRTYTAAGDPFYSYSERIKKEASDLYAASDYHASAASLRSLVGLGKGLTPSGDDFVSGLIAGIYSYSYEDHPFSLALSDMLSDVRDRTNDISSAFIEAALDGQASLPIIHFIEEPSSESMDEIKTIGHSSGMDALEGLLYFHRLLYYSNKL